MEWLIQKNKNWKVDIENKKAFQREYNRKRKRNGVWKHKGLIKINIFLGKHSLEYFLFSNQI